MGERLAGFDGDHAEMWLLMGALPVVIVVVAVDLIDFIHCTRPNADVFATCAGEEE